MNDAPMSSPVPYLVRALHQWIIDNGMTPHLLVDTNVPGVDVPIAYVKEGRIILNLSYIATEHLRIDHDMISCTARFGGRPTAIYVPMRAVISMYSRESGHGMQLDHLHPKEAAPEVKAMETTNDAPPVAEVSTATVATQSVPPPRSAGGRSHLRVVK